VEAKVIAQLSLDSMGNKKERHPKCLGYYEVWSGEYDCGYNTNIVCDECKYGAGRKDPEAACNTL
jgi:hypothetical protein